jgi:hypothetical protein
MTREQNFRSSFISQFATYSSSQNILRIDLKKLPPSFFPAFSLELGKTKYTSFDPSGTASVGEQDFTITMFFTLPQNHTEDAYLDHSDLTNLLEEFVNTPIYSPPGISPGETYHIERAMLIEAKAPVVEIGDTRYAVNMSCKYIFTIF